MTWGKPGDHYKLFPETINPMGSKAPPRAKETSKEKMSELMGKRFSLWKIQHSLEKVQQETLVNVLPAQGSSHYATDL